MFERFARMLPLLLMPCTLAACGGTLPHRVAGRLPARSYGNGENALNEHWTRETRRVNCATPDGETRNEITYYKNSLGMEFALIPAGRFEMGSALSPEETAKRFGGDAEDFADEHPRHAVRISRAFLMGAYEVTNAQYRRFVADHSSGDYRGESLNGDAQPVACVSRDDAVHFCDWLSKQDGMTYRLPTEGEWEYACRAGSATAYPWGEEIDASRCNFADVNAPSIPWRDETSDDGYAVTAPVGSFSPNAFGLYDMIGNVWEWTSDWYGAESYAKSPPENPTGPASDPLMNRVLRGGSWMNAPGFCRSAFRMKAMQANCSANGGFRLVVELPEP